MTRKTFEAARDCTAKIKNLTPTEAQIKEMFTFLSSTDRLAEICQWEGISGLTLEAGNLPETTSYEKAFKESIYMYLEGAGIIEASDHIADKYFIENPAGYDAAIFFAAVYSVSCLLKGELAYSFIDKALQYLLPDGWQWNEEDKKEADAHKDDKSWYSLLHSHRKAFIGEHREESQHRFDEIKICNLITEKDPVSEKIGKRIGEMLSNYKDGALQFIMKKLTYPDIEKALYVLPKETEDRIISNLSPFSITIIKGDCILNKDTISPIDIRNAVKRFEEEINAYDGDRDLEAGYAN